MTQTTPLSSLYKQYSELKERMTLLQAEMHAARHNMIYQTPQEIQNMTTDELKALLLVIPDLIKGQEVHGRRF